MADKKIQLAMVETAIGNLEKRGILSFDDQELYALLIKLREKIKQDSYKVEWSSFIPVMVKLGVEIFEHVLKK